MNTQHPSNNTPKLKTETGEAFQIPENGSLGLLALGYVGLMLWRQERHRLQQERLQHNNIPKSTQNA